MITKMAFVSHPTRDMAAARKFFGDLLGLKLGSSYEDKWCEFDTPDGKSIALDTFSPPDKGPYLALETDDIEKEIARLRRKGVPVVMDVMDNKVCKMAIVQDPSGHSIMLHQMEATRLKALEASRKAPASGASKPRARAAGKASPAGTAKSSATRRGGAAGKPAAAASKAAGGRKKSAASGRSSSTARASSRTATRPARPTRGR